MFSSELFYSWSLYYLQNIRKRGSLYTIIPNGLIDKWKYAGFRGLVLSYTVNYRTKPRTQAPKNKTAFFLSGYAALDYQRRFKKVQFLFF